MNNPLLQLRALGQSVWYDNVDRAQIVSGEFQRLLEEDVIVGTTANPTTFEKAIAQGHAYDEQLAQLRGAGKSTGEIYDALVGTDIRRVADLLRPIHERTDRKDGYVSLEVSPELAHDTQGTLAEVRRYWRSIEHPNLMIKIPATPAGLPAIRQALSEGINVNITLIFSLDNYRQVAEAYLQALEQRRSRGLDLRRIASVASFFVSRVDVLVDKLLEERIQASRDEAEKERLKGLRGQAAIANARLVYREFKRTFGSERFAALERSGARVQRPLWASTGAKNPAYRDVLYAEELIGPNTVDTMPMQTIQAFRDHGRVRLSIEEDVDGAAATLAALEELGIRYAEITQRLQDEGVRKFADSYHQLLANIESKRGRAG